MNNTIVTSFFIYVRLGTSILYVQCVLRATLSKRNFWTVVLIIRLLKHFRSRPSPQKYFNTELFSIYGRFATVHTSQFSDALHAGYRLSWHPYPYSLQPYWYLTHNTNIILLQWLDVQTNTLSHSRQFGPYLQGVVVWEQDHNRHICTWPSILFHMLPNTTRTCDLCIP